MSEVDRGVSGAANGVTWMGGIPKSWGLGKFSREILIAEGQVNPEDEPFSEMPLLAPNHVEPGTGRIVGRETAREQAAESGKYLCEAGDVVYSKIRPALRKAVLVNERCLCSADMYPLRSRGRLDPRYLLYLLLSDRFTAWAVQESARVAMPKVNRDSLNDLRLPVPPAPEQVAIVRFLDREMARMDVLLAAKQQVLDLLAARRRALIARATTRGVDSDVELRDSGIPWLGAIPAHWSVERARWLFWERDERSESGQEELLTVSHLTGVTPRSEKDVTMFEADTTEGYKVCLPGDLVINTLWAWMGAMGVAPMKGIVSPAYNVYQTGPLLLPAFVDALVRIPQFAQEVTRYSKGVWSSRLRLYPEGFFEVFFPVPPIREQEAIVAHIAREVAKIESLGAATTRTIALLKERRTALIAAAVTGRIDVTAERPGRENEVGVA